LDPYPMQHVKSASVMKMRYRDIPTAMSSFTAAFKYDPMIIYLRDHEPIQNTWMQIIRSAFQCLMSFAMWALYIHQGNAYTVGGGKACVTYMDPRQSPHPVYDFNARFTPVTGVQYTKEQKKRYTEFVEKYSDALKGSLGDRQSEAFHLRLLFTDPSKQSLGYGSSLAQVVTDTVTGVPYNQFGPLADLFW